MPLDEDEHPPEPEGEEIDDPSRIGGRKWWRIVLLVFLAVFLVVAGFGWLNRERIVDNLIAGQLAELGIPAQYEIKQIGLGRQVLEHVVIGDATRPDLTIERVEVKTVLRFGFPRFGHVMLVRPRLFGSYRDSKLSFGNLDPVIFTDSEEPFEAPDLDLVIRDGRGLIESDFGPVGIKTEGAGGLRDGFSGMLAVTAPMLTLEGCEAKDASLYGKLGVTAKNPLFSGPLRLGGITCKRQGLRLGKSQVQLDLAIDRQFDGGEGKLSISSGTLRLGENAIRSVAGKVRMTYRRNGLVADYDLAGKALSTPQAELASIALEGSARSARGFERLDVQARVEGKGLALGSGFGADLASAIQAGEGTLIQPVLEQVRASLSRESRGSSLAGSFVLRRSSESTSLVVPQAAVKGGSGQELLSISRLQLGFDGAGKANLSGNFATGGSGLPKIAGRMEGGPGSRLGMNIRMLEYRAGDASFALPRLVVVQQPGGGLGFTGEARLSGAIPGGRVEALAVPLDGNWSSRNGLAVWRKCVELRFERLDLSELRFDRDKLAICPPRGGAIVRSTAGGIRAVAGLAGLDMAGKLGSSPVRIKSGPTALAWPGKMKVRDIAVALGPAGYVSDFRIGRIDGQLGDTITGRFEEVDMQLDAVPLDVLGAAGAWQFADGVLTLSEGSFRLEDREQVDRFQPLVARDASLGLADNVITAEARLREPQSLREIVRTELRHDLTTGVGSADLFADGVRFDGRLQPDTLTYLALGVIANASGEVRGTGRIDWNEQDVTSTGNVTTDSLDFAAAFGPVQGLSGTVEFTDLLGLVTAPDQELRIAAINPGIEVNDGILTFAIEPDYVLRVEGAHWPFMGGLLTLQPVMMTIGSDEVLRYTLLIDELDAGRFLERIEMENLSATGQFEGTIPLVFDEDGGRIEGGSLVSLPPGGNISYVGELTYEDLSAMGNFAFDALRSLDFKRMQIGIDGSLEGELVTHVTFDGLGQGELASRNFVTRQVAKLPIRFMVNIRAPFFRLVTSVRSLYDAEYLRNPESLGLLDLPVPPGSVVDPTTPADKSIQPPDSETMP